MHVMELLRRLFENYKAQEVASDALMKEIGSIVEPAVKAMVDADRHECARLVAYLGRVSRVSGMPITTDQIAASIATGRRAPEGTEAPPAFEAERALVRRLRTVPERYAGREEEMNQERAEAADTIERLAGLAGVI